MGSAVLQLSIWGTHPEITLHLDDTLPSGWTILPPLPTPWWPGTYAICPHIVILVVHGN